MPILQNKLVIKSIEALHDEALALVNDTDRNHDVTALPKILHNDRPPREAPINMPKETLGDSSSETAVKHDIMTRIDDLLRKLDEHEDVAITPPLEKGPNSNAKDPTSDAFDRTADDNSNEMFDDNQNEEKPRPNQTQALADIAEAIYKAQHQQVDTASVNARQNNSTPLDMDALSATVATEVRRTVSAVISEQLPHLIRDAIGEEIRALPVNALSQSKPVIGNPTAAKTNTARKTAATVKSRGKKTETKKTVVKKAADKISSKKLSVKKLKPKKTNTKTTDKAYQ